MTCGDAKSGLGRILGRLETSGVPYEVLDHGCADPENDPFYSAHGANIVKSMVFLLPGPSYVICSLRLQDRIDYGRLASAIGADRRSIKPAAPQEIEELFGMPIGGVGPFHYDRKGTVVLDENIFSLERVICGIGSLSQSLVISPSDLRAVSLGEVFAVSKCDAAANFAHGMGSGILAEGPCLLKKR